MTIRDLIAGIERLRAHGLTDETLLTVQVFTTTGVAEAGLETLSLCFDTHDWRTDHTEVYLALVGRDDD